MTALTYTKEKVSEAQLQSLFDSINIQFFNLELPLCRIKWSDRLGNNGKTCHREHDFTVFEDKQFPPVIRLSRTLLWEKPPEKIAELLFQQLIQIWLWSKGRPWGLTPEFTQKARTFDFSLLAPLSAPALNA